MVRHPRGTPLTQLLDPVGYAEYQTLVMRTGEVVIAWGHVEEALERVLQLVSGCEAAAAEIIYYTPQSYSGRVAIIQNLIRHLMPDGPEKDLLNRALAKLDRLSKARNGFVHSTVRYHVRIGGVPKPKGVLRRRLVHPVRASVATNIKPTLNDLEVHLQKVNGIVRLLEAITDDHPIQAAAVRRIEDIAFQTDTAASS